MGQWQRSPQLDAVVHIGLVCQALRAALGMHDAPPRRHPVDGAGLDLLHIAQTVAVHGGAREQIGHRRQANVRMGPHIVAVARCHGHRTEVIEKQEGPHGLALHSGQQAAHGETAAQVLGMAREGQKRSAGGIAHAARSTTVLISVVTVVINLCTGHFCATASSSAIWASVRSPLTCSRVARR